MKKDFWSNAQIAVIGGGSWGTVLANLASTNCRNVRMWVREEEQAREINATRTNPKYFPDLTLSEKVKAYSDLERVFEVDQDCVIWALPSKVTREIGAQVAPRFRGDELIIHATKGVEPGTLKRISVVLEEEVPCRRIGVISGPNLAGEVAKREPAATVIASKYDEVLSAGKSIFETEQFRVYSTKDMVGVEWAGTLKNVLAVASGALDALGLGMNTRAMLLSRGLAEMTRFAVGLGAEPKTFMGLAGMGDLIATCSSVLSRNYRVGFQLGKGEKIDSILQSLGVTAEGVTTARSVWKFAQERNVQMPITEAVYLMIEGKITAPDALYRLMNSPTIEDFA